jgi:hypothetical protein
MFTKDASGNIVTVALGGSGSENIVEADTAAGFPSAGSAGTLYHAINTSRLYFYDASGVYVEAGTSGGGGGGSAALTAATSSELGGIKVGSGLTITDGVLSAAGDTVLRSLFVPGAPTSVTATGGNAQAAVSWTAPTGVISQAPITDYVVQYSSNSGSTWTTFSDGTSTATSATVTGLTNGTAYAFRVAAVNAIGTGSYSSASSAVTPSASPILAPPNLLGWWDASDSATVFSDTSGITAASSGGAVRRWLDKSGNGNHGTIPVDSVGGGGGPPSLVSAQQNGLSALQFFNYGAGFTIGNKLPISSTGATIFAVVRPSQNAIDSGFLLAKSRWKLKASYIEWLNTSYSSSSWNYDGSTFDWHVMALSIPSQNFAGAALYRNGSVISSPSIYNPDSQGAPSATTDALTIGYVEGSAGTFRNYIGEIIVYESELSSSNRNSVTTYLKAKWGIS